MVDVAMRRVRVNGSAVELTPKEFDLLALFAQNPGRPFSRDELLDRIWRDDYEVTDRTIDTHVQRLRKKLGDQSGVIQTVWGVGYRFERAEPGGSVEARTLPMMMPAGATAGLRAAAISTARSAAPEEAVRQMHQQLTETLNRDEGHVDPGLAALVSAAE